MKKEEISVGDRIKDTYKLDNYGLATVTELTERGFKYKLDKPISFIAREGSMIFGGESYLVGDTDAETQWLETVCCWEKVNISYDI